MALSSLPHSPSISFPAFPPNVPIDFLCALENVGRSGPLRNHFMAVNAVSDTHGRSLSSVYFAPRPAMLTYADKVNSENVRHPSRALDLQSKDGK